MGLQVDRLDVEQRVVDRDGQHVAANHVRTPLVPKRQLAREVAVLVDLGFHLLGTEHALLLGETIGQQPAVILPVAHAGDPADHYLPVLGREGQNLHKLDVVRLGRLPHHVIRLDRLHLGIVLLRGPNPEVLLVVEHRRIGHVILGVNQPLSQQEALGIAHVGPQLLGHFLLGSQQAGKDPLPDLDDRVFRFKDVEGHRTLVGVDHRLDGVAHIILPAQVVGPLTRGCRPGDPPRSAARATQKGLAVGVVARGGVGVDDPVELAVGKHDVGVLVEVEEGSQRLGPLANLAAEHDTAFLRRVAGQEQARAPQLPAIDELPPEIVQRHAASPCVARVGVLVAARIVELRLVGIDHHVGVGQLTVVDFGTLDLQAGLRGLGREVLDQQVGQPVGGELAGRGQCQAVAVRVLEMAVDERLALLGQIVEVHLPGRDHHLAVIVADRIAVDVHVRKLVVEADFLKLLVHLHQGPRVPEPHL